MTNLTIANQTAGQSMPGATERMTILPNPSTPGEFVQPFIQLDSSGSAISAPRTPSAPATASVGATSATLIAANSNRKRLEIKNLGSTRISLGLNATALNNSGLVLDPGQSYCFEGSNLVTTVINAICATSATVAIQEWT